MTKQVITSSLRLVNCEADKTIKIYKEDSVTEEKASEICQLGDKSVSMCELEPTFH